MNGDTSCWPKLKSRQERRVNKLNSMIVIIKQFYHSCHLIIIITMCFTVQGQHGIISISYRIIMMLLLHGIKNSEELSSFYDTNKFLVLYFVVFVQNLEKQSDWLVHFTSLFCEKKSLAWMSSPNISLWRGGWTCSLGKEFDVSLH